MKSNFKIYFAILIVLINAACAASINKQDIQAGSNLPETARVEGISIPYDLNLPKFVLAIEPFGVNQNISIVTSSTGSNYCKNGYCSSTTTVGGYGNEVSSQLITALSKVGNISLVDFSAVKKDKEGNYTAKLLRGEKGLFILRGNLTELAENIESDSKNNSFSLGWIGLVGGIVGAVAHKPGLAYAGAGVFGANPGYESDKRTRKGMVAFDIQIIDSRTNRIVGSNRVNGTFTAESAINGFSIFGYSNKKHDFAQSALGQAMRVAMNEAVKKVWDDLNKLH